MKKILIIDDEVDLCILLKSYFEQKQYEVVVANTLTQGLDQLSANKPDYVFLDNNLPDGRGWDKYEWILENLPQVNLFLISAFRSSLHKKPDSNRLRIIEKPLSIKLIDSLIS